MLNLSPFFFSDGTHLALKESFTGYAKKKDDEYVDIFINPPFVYFRSRLGLSADLKGARECDR